MPGLVGALGTIELGTSGAALTTLNYGQPPTANNLLVCWVSGFGGATAPATPSGWTSQGTSNLGSGCSATAFTKTAVGGDTAPTIAAGTAITWTGQLGEFSGCATVSPEDNRAAGHGTTSPVSAVSTTLDTAAGQLVLGVSTFRYTVAATKTLSDTLATVASTNDTTNGATNTINHYGFSWGITTSNATGTGLSSAFTPANIGAVNVLVVTFKRATSSHTVSATESAASTDSPTVINALNATAVDTAAATDTLAATKTLLKTASDSAATGELLRVTESLRKSCSETVIAADTLHVVETLHASGTEIAATIESVKTVETLHVHATETVTVVDVAAAAGSSRRVRNLSEFATGVDMPVRIVTVRRVLGDTAVAFDSLGGHAANTRTATETVLTGDTVARVASFMRIVGNLLVPTIGLYPSTGLYPGGSGEGAFGVDQAGFAQGHNRIVTEQATATDMLTRVESTVRALVESAHATDVVVVSGNLSATAGEVAVSLDTATLRVHLIKTAADGAASVDLVASGSASAQHRQVSEFVQARDMVTVGSHAAKVASELAAVVDTVISASTFARFTGDEASASDTVSLVVRWLKTVADESDTVDAASGPVGTVRDTGGDFAATDDSAFTGVQGVAAIAVDQAVSADAIVDVFVIIVLTQAGLVESQGVQGLTVTTPTGGLVTTINP